MDYSRLPIIILVLASTVAPFPSGKPQNAASNKTVADIGTKAVKFPSSAPSGSVVRTPSGNWSSSSRPKNGSRISEADSDAIAFPDSLENRSFVPRIDKRSPECLKSTFCENVEDYPSSYLDSLLQNVAVEFKLLFGNDLITDTNIVHRIDSGSDDSPLCPYEERLVFPQSAKNKDNEWVFIVNHGNYRQGVQIEKCLTDNSDGNCSLIFVPAGYETRCRQKYVYRKLYAIDKDGNTTSDTFQLPSCCSCVARRTKDSFRSLVRSSAKKN